MKQCFLAVLVLLSSFSLRAAPGDTTWVQAHSDKWLDWYNNFDTTVTFPDGSVSYRKVIMVFTLGKYVCPGNPQYCADWDYTVQTKLMTPGGDTVELGRLITPYANSASMPASWKGVYRYDVTDFYPLLKNSATVRVHYSGYSGGFTANVRFAFIEGTPPRNVVGITPIWKNSYNYGHGPVAINAALGNVSLTAPTGTVSAENKFTITGHGGDAQGCAEFCPNSFTMNLNNNQLVQQNFWRADCGYNNYYPQNGTWVFDRAGWCPGDSITPYSYALPGVTANGNYTLNVTFPNYTSVPSSTNSQASYIIESAVVYYGGFNKTLDASLDDIIAPTNSQTHYRSNPHTGDPLISVRNEGSSTITSIKFQYGLVGSPLAERTWSGSIASLQSSIISLPDIAALKAATGSNNSFTVKILEVNGQADADPTNNELSSQFVAPQSWPAKITIRFKTNRSVFNGFSESSWKIYDANNTVVNQRIDNDIDSIYLDTVTLGFGTYRLEVSDAGCDGINWWFFAAYNPNPGAGFIQVRPLGASIPYTLNGYFNGDFGCGFTQYFTSNWPTGIDDVPAANQPQLQAYPNPAHQTVTLAFTGLNKVNGDAHILDALGRVVLTQRCTTAEQQINIKSLSSGIYTIRYSDNQLNLQTRLIITR